MFFEPSTIASLLSALCRTLDDYGCDSRELLRQSGLDPGRLAVSGWRVPVRLMQRVWELALDTTGDRCLGLRVAERIRPGDLHALGLAWMASSSVADAMLRLERYQRVLSAALDVKFVTVGEESFLHLPMPGRSAGLVAPGDDLAVKDQPWPAAPVDAFFATLTMLCRTLAGEDFAPLRVELRRSDFGAGEVYRSAYRAPVEFSAPRNAAVFRRKDLEAPVSASNPELAMQIDGIAERYLRSVESTPTVALVRSMLIDMLPSGSTSQEEVARRIHSSVSTLQRQLRREGSSYRGVLDETRKELALRYVEDGRYALSEVAFLLGFADQASMSRAFKRWTGSSPGSYTARDLGAAPEAPSGSSRTD